MASSVGSSRSVRTSARQSADRQPFLGNLDSVSIKVSDKPKQRMTDEEVKAILKGVPEDTQLKKALDVVDQALKDTRPS